MVTLYVWELFTSLEAYIIMRYDNRLNKNSPNSQCIFQQRREVGVTIGI